MEINEEIIKNTSDQQELIRMKLYLIRKLDSLKNYIDINEGDIITEAHYKEARNSKEYKNDIVFLEFEGINL